MENSMMNHAATRSLQSRPTKKRLPQPLLKMIGTNTGFEPKDHVTLGKELDIIDIERGVRLAGTRNYVLKGDGALLHQAGLRIVQLGRTRVKTRHLWWMIFYPVFALLTRLEMRHPVGSPRRNGERDLVRWMTHPAMLLSEQLLLTARREQLAGDDVC